MKYIPQILCWSLFIAVALPFTIIGFLVGWTHAVLHGGYLNGLEAPGKIVDSRWMIGK